MNPTIMVVEDEPAIQDLIQINLQMGGKALSFWHLRDLFQGEIRPEISHGAEGTMGAVTPTPTSEN